MKRIPDLLLRTSRQLFDDIDERQAFVQALTDPQPFHPSIFWNQPRPQPHPFTPIAPLNWQPEFVDRLPLDTSIKTHTLYRSGGFYGLDLSAVFGLAPLLDLPPHPDLVIDVCAAPGGKSIFAWRSLQPRQLLTNDRRPKRHLKLLNNLRRCQVRPAAVLGVDASVLSVVIPQTAAVVIVEPPCTGQSRLARGGQMPGCFHPVTIAQYVKRQKRILSHALQLVAPGGHLLYMTKTYTPDENERVLDWVRSQFPQFQAQPIERLAKYQSALSEQPCYRLFPQSGQGAGAFTALLQNQQAGEAKRIPIGFFAQASVQLLS
jgi:16S rRNA C967 or C1407 C5-methylase (RsmB/RsmF family)